MRILGGRSRLPSGFLLPGRPSSLRQRCSNVQGENLNSTAAQQRDFSFQAAISQFSGSIDVIDLAGHRCLVPSSSVTIALQTALGLVAAESGVCLAPASVERLRRDNVVYRPLQETDAVSPIVMKTCKGDKSSELALILLLIKEIYRKEGITFGT
jgi:hypothetical protein